MRNLVGLFLLVTGGFLLTGCHPNIDITFENRTDKSVFVEVNNGGFEEIKAGRTGTISYLIDSLDSDERIEITVENEGGDVLYHELTTKGALEEKGKRIIIEEPSSWQPADPETATALQP